MPAGLPASAAKDLKARRAARQQKELIEEVEVTARTTAKVEELVPHPDNPRGHDLGDLEDTAQSMRTLGVLEPLVVTTRDAHLATYPYHAETIGTAKYVVVAGHRRLAAARIAELGEVPIEVRPDLSKDGLDYEVMAVENFHREGLKPLEEARLFANLVTRGRSQRAIAERNGISQSHVSKRVSLLTLPEPIQAAVADETLPVADALELVKLTGGEDQTAAWKLIRASGLKASDAVARQRDLAAVAARVARAHERATSEQLAIVDPATAWNGTIADRRLTGEAAITEARDAGHLAAAVDRDGGFHYVTTAQPEPDPEPDTESEPEPAVAEPGPQAATGNPVVPAQKSGPDKKKPDREKEADDLAVATDAHERKSAAQAREAVCARIAVRKQLVAETLRRVTAAALSLGLDARALKLAHRWLREAGIGPAIDDPHAYAAAALETGDGLDRRLAYAMALAADEIRVQRAGEAWDAHAAGHVRRLMADAEHSPSDWERRRIEAAEEAIPAES